ncbi:SDR family oxidoreductase [Thalassococcus sp. S3]|uniref:SDR family oxidoreductase n=1 Tax=Thalassococcus sp. S3 TaxID=2017482 RepID=UPI0010248870|nr:SDR family oxidoreductase [Thalassococcus sp. S3]QBF34125.1 short-chain dehydrogenase [Thalassococcus sp. S3]
MDVSGKTVVITGAASGIGAALARQMAQAGAHVVIADLQEQAAIDLAQQIGGLAVSCDVTREGDIRAVVEKAEDAFGQVDIFVSNAGLGRGEPDHAASASDEVWQLNWDVHVMSHVYAARAVLPKMIERGEGYLVQMASAAGLLCQIGDAAYSATKHAAVSFAESLAITHGMDGIKVSVICPQYVATPLIGLTEEAAEGRPSLLTPDDAAKAIMQGIQEEVFLILPHKEVQEYTRLKSTDYERWLQGMRLLRAKAIDDMGSLQPQNFYKLM